MDDRGFKRMPQRYLSERVKGLPIDRISQMLQNVQALTAALSKQNYFVYF